MHGYAKILELAISSVEQNISRVNEANERGIPCSTREIYFIFSNIFAQKKSKFLLRTM